MSEEIAGPDGRKVCSARGCTRQASFEILWNNPKIHTPERRKIWLACTDHEESLRTFLNARGFWKESVALDVVT